VSFIVNSLRMNNFRSYEKGYIEFDSHITILHGPNAAGKTNIIEALHLLTTGESFRNPKKDDLPLWGADKTQIEFVATDGNLRRDVEIIISKEDKTTLLNGKKITSKYEMLSALPCVIFNPDDLRIVKEAAARRRQEIDTLGSQLSPNYSKLISEYKKITTQRNKMLKEGNYKGDIFEAWTNRLIDVGIALTEKRIALFERIQPHVEKYYLELIGDNENEESLLVRYESARGNNDVISFQDALNKREEDEIIRKQTLVGPHRDDIIFEINGKEARSLASQGQQRSIALAWKLAQLSVIKEFSNNKPLLLLDDVMSELDQKRRNYLAQIVGEAAQTVITTANIDYFDKNLLKRAKVVLVPEHIISSE